MYINVPKRILTRSLAVAVFIALLWSAVPSTALSDAGAPDVEVQFLVDGEQGHGFLLVTGTLPEDVELPATLTLPVPGGAELWWAGELTGGGAEEDIQRQVSLVDGEGGLVVEFSLETTRVGQYDALYLPSIVVGDERQAVLEWVQSAPVATLRFAVRMPAGMEVLSMDPLPVGDPATNRLGETLYALPGMEVELGQVVAVSVDFRRESLLDTGFSWTTSNTLAVLGLAVVILLLVVGLLARRQNARRPLEDGPAETDD